MANPGTQTVGTAFNVTITAIDTYGNTATGYNPPNFSTVNLSGPANAPDGTAPNYQGNFCFFGCFTNGVLTPQVTLYDAQTTTIMASVNGISGTSTSFTVNPGGTVDFNVTGYPSPTRPGWPTTSRSPRSTPTATWPPATPARSTSPAATAQAVLPANYTFTAADAGTHTFTVTLETAGTQSITATDTTTRAITGTRASITVQPGRGHVADASPAYPPPTRPARPTRHRHGL